MTKQHKATIELSNVRVKTKLMYIMPSLNNIIKGETPVVVEITNMNMLTSLFEFICWLRVEKNKKRITVCLHLVVCRFFNKKLVETVSMNPVIMDLVSTMLSR